MHYLKSNNCISRLTVNSPTLFFFSIANIRLMINTILTQEHFSYFFAHTSNYCIQQKRLCCQLIPKIKLMIVLLLIKSSYTKYDMTNVRKNHEHVILLILSISELKESNKLSGSFGDSFLMEHDT